jgi:hypothetical protein
VYGFTFKIDERLAPPDAPGMAEKKDEMVACVCLCSGARPVMDWKLGSIVSIDTKKKRVACGVNGVEWLRGGNWGFI